VSAPASTASSPARDARLFSSTIGKKAVMAATGLLLYGFVVVHMIGNLQVYMGAEAIDAYGAFLHGYREWQARESTYASRTMMWTGPLLLAFIVYHLAHFTTGTVHPEFVPGSVYRNMVVGFQNPFASAFYILAMLALGLHMYHGFWSMLQTLGLSQPRWNRVRRPLAALLAFGVVAGNISIPVAVLTGVLHL
jgi:succinate dehydrogenase / fumarate reductase cytochrome b subunit